MCFLATPDLDGFFRALGRLHPVVVHFPLVFVLVLGVGAVGLLRRPWSAPSRFVTRGSRLSAVTAAIAAFMGWLGAETAGYSGAVLERHRWVGVAVAVTAVIAAAWVHAAARRPTPWRTRLAAFWLLVAAGMVADAGHHGGLLVHGEDFFARLLEAPPSAAPASPGTVPDFTRDVEPILIRRCHACHGFGAPSSELRLDRRAEAVRGGKSGLPAITPGNPAASALMTRVTSKNPALVMPPKGAGLTAAEIAVLERWIAGGAPYSARPDDVSWHWAYRPPVRANPPAVQDTDWPRSPIDHFVLAGLESTGLTPAPEASRSTLIRRLSLDLTGLPPTPEDVAAFVADEDHDAYDRVVARLLASPAYGEHQARHWLDLARYADTHGYEKDGRRVMWPWRDWVIDAFNSDMPFDRFTIEQVAGDLLPSPTEEQTVATGFHRNSMINEEGGTDPEEFRIEAVIDRANTTAAVWLGTTLACAQCHDHKFDPLSQRDYYRFMAFFNSSASDTEIVSSHATMAAGPRIAVAAREHRGRHKVLLEEELRLESLGAEAGPELAAVRRELKEIPTAETMVMRELPARRPTRIHLGGDFRRLGDTVLPGTPAAMGPPTPEGSADRLTLARWLMSPDNPLTARVQVNRLWERLFGTGLVESGADFGTQGEPPSHPELLDWLATEFTRRTWSMKAMHRLLVSSSTYRQSSAADAAAIERDPRGRLLGRAPRFRLDAETIRDVSLAAAGLLSPKIGGPSVFPPQPPGIWTMIYSSDTWTDSLGADRHRRGLYTFWRRTVSYPSFVTFDAPSREVTCTGRSRTNTPLQALVTLNDPVYMECAVALAARMQREAGPAARDRVVRGFELCVSRRPDAHELERVLQLHDDQVQAFRARPEAARALVTASGSEEDVADEAAWIIVANVLLNLDETLSRS